MNLFRLFILLPLFFFHAPNSFAKVKWQKTTINRFDLPAEFSVAVSAYIGGYLFDIEGLTSPWAKVEFYSTEGNIQVTTIADNEGVFLFRSVLAPLQTGDFCFISYDTDSIANNPLCFPPPPPQTKTTISGIVLSPTISLDKEIFRQNELVEARGRAFPNAQIKTFLFEQERSWWQEIIDVIIPAAFAREGPKLTITASKEGFFSFNLPTQKSTRWRFFVGPQLTDETPTAQSNTIEFLALSWWQWLLLKILRFVYHVLRWLFSFLFRWETIIALLITSISIICFKLKSKNAPKQSKHATR